MTRESHVVELVDLSGKAIGAASVADAHRAPGQLHRAFSVFLRDPGNGRVLLQQRASVKTRFPLRWANSCCGHPLPGEDITVAARRRLAEELGIDGVSLAPVGIYTYRAEDPGSGRVEHEYDHVLLGDLPIGARVTPDPSEVADTRWVTVSALTAGLTADPGSYAPWLPGVTGCLVSHLSAFSAPVEAPSAPLAASSAPVEAPSAPVEAPSAPVEASSAHVEAPSAHVEAPERSGGR